MYQTEKSSWLKHWDFILLDLLFLQLAYILACMIRHGGRFPYGMRDYRILGIFLILVQVCFSFALNNYEGILRRGYFQELRQVVILVSLVVLAALVYLFFIKSTQRYSRYVILLMWVLGIVFVYLERIFWKRVVRSRMKKRERLQRLVLIAPSSRAEILAEELEKPEYADFYLSNILLLDGKAGTVIHDHTVPFSGEAILPYLEEQVVDQIFLSGDREDPLVQKVFELCHERGITLHFNLGDLFPAEQKFMVENFYGQAVLTSSVQFVKDWQLLVKRLMDIAGGIVGLICTGILTVILAPIIYVQSPGPVFFSQERVGLNGRKFRIYKFRSMYPDAEERKKDLMDQNKMQGQMFKMDHDPRVLPIGRFIRKTSLDEFPQFLNVLKGDMSLVGTRPPTVDEYENYDVHHKIRLAIKPGMTGLWQVSGRSDIVDFEEVVRLDRKYIDEWSLKLDVKILLQTLKLMVTGRGSV